MKKILCILLLAVCSLTFSMQADDQAARLEKAIKRATRGGRLYRTIIIPLATIKAWELVMASEEKKEEFRKTLEEIKEGNIPQPVVTIFRKIKIQGPELVRDVFQKIEDVLTKEK